MRLNDPRNVARRGGRVVPPITGTPVPPARYGGTEYRTRDEMPPLIRAVSDALDDYLHRHHGIITSHTNPETLIAALRDEGYDIVPAAPTTTEVTGE
jgi:hypothetical protein